MSRCMQLTRRLRKSSTDCVSLSSSCNMGISLEHSCIARQALLHQFPFPSTYLLLKFQSSSRASLVSPFRLTLASPILNTEALTQQTVMLAATLQGSMIGSLTSCSTVFLVALDM